LTSSRCVARSHSPTHVSSASSTTHAWTTNYEDTELIVDRERKVILEWRALFDGRVFERHYFTEIAFDEPMDEAEFYPAGRTGR